MWYHSSTNLTVGNKSWASLSEIDICGIILLTLFCKISQNYIFLIVSRLLVEDVSLSMFKVKIEFIALVYLYSSKSVYICYLNCLSLLALLWSQFHSRHHSLFGLERQQNCVENNQGLRHIFIRRVILLFRNTWQHWGCVLAYLALQTSMVVAPPLLVLRQVVLTHSALYA